MGLLFDAFVVQVKSVLLINAEKSNRRTKFRTESPTKGPTAADGFSDDAFQ